ncbi:acyltransferase [Candidatus Woesebacteria bacterium]|nr:acyltransferase [Candidatus Woesebacteria bacterium]
MNVTDKTGKKLSTEEIFQKGTRRFEDIMRELFLYVVYILGFFPLSVVRMVLYRLSGVRIHSSSTINMGARFYEPSNITIGKDTIVGEHAVLDGRADLVIGDHVDIATGVMIYNAQHDIHDPDFKPVMAPVTIEEYVFIGPRVTILPGVTIHKGAVVAAGAVVTKDIPSGEMWAGVPAQKIGDRKLKNPSYRLRRKGLWDIIG